MSILDGFFKTKKYRKTSEGYKLQSEWTSANTVEYENGLTLQESEVYLTQAEYDALGDEKYTNNVKYYITDNSNVSGVGVGKDLTLEEYNALSDEEKNNGTIYFVDDGSEVITASNIDYDNTDSTLDAGTVQGAIDEINSKYDECFQSVSDGKTLVASAITDKGVETASDATFETMATNIGAIPVGKCISLGTGTSFNVQTVCANNGIDYTKLTTSNFITGAKSVPKTVTTTDHLDGGYYGWAQANGFSVSHSYNASTGVLTVSGGAQAIHFWDSVQNTSIQSKTQTATCFAYLVYTG